MSSIHNRFREIRLSNSFRFVFVKFYIELFVFPIEFHLCQIHFYRFSFESTNAVYGWDTLIPWNCDGNAWNFMELHGIAWNRDRLELCLNCGEILANSSGIAWNCGIIVSNCDGIPLV